MSGTAPHRVLVIGGTSEIGLATVRALLRRRDAHAALEVYLLGRDRARLEQELDALGRDGAVGGDVAVLEADDLDSHEATIDALFERSSGFELVLLAIGSLGAQGGLDAPREEALEVMRVNFVDCGSLMLATLRALRAQRHGTLVVLSSVGAERVRATNAVYGAAKAGLDALAQGLADSLRGSGVRVLVVRPGFVKTRMTASLKPPPFSTTPDVVGEAIVKGLSGSAHTVWVPGLLRYMFMMLRHLPRSVYSRLPL
jgi:decaprenylphospho-beta-D-erythro-pentofuranosid-2-ulose 2-reductase